MTPRTAVLFAGQGTLDPFALRSLREQSALVRSHVELALEALSLSWSRACAPSGAALRDTRAQQSLLVAVQLGLLEELRAVREGIEYELCAGHSVGELSAWCASGAITANDARSLALARGAAMSECARERPGAMVALTGATEPYASDVLAQCSAQGIAVIAARNAEDEWVLSGELRAMRVAMAAVGATVLPVSGAWHSPLVEPAVERARSALDSVTFNSESSAQLISCVTGSPAANSDARALIERCVTAPVQWWDVTRTLASEKIERCVILGPGRNVRGWLRRAVGACEIVHVDDGEQLARLRSITR